MGTARFSRRDAFAGTSQGTARARLLGETTARGGEVVDLVAMESGGDDTPVAGGNEVRAVGGFIHDEGWHMVKYR